MPQLFSIRASAKSLMGFVPSGGRSVQTKSNWSAPVGLSERPTSRTPAPRANHPTFWTHLNLTACSVDGSGAWVGSCIRLVFSLSSNSFVRWFLCETEGCCNIHVDRLTSFRAARGWVRRSFGRGNAFMAGYLLVESPGMLIRFNQNAPECTRISRYLFLADEQPKPNFPEGEEFVAALLTR